MFKKNSKYRWITFLLATWLFAHMSVNGFYEFANNKNGMMLILGIICGVMIIIYFVDLIAFIKNRKSIKAGE